MKHLNLRSLRRKVNNKTTSFSSQKPCHLKTEKTYNHRSKRKPRGSRDSKESNASWKRKFRGWSRMKDWNVRGCSWNWLTIWTRMSWSLMTRWGTLWSHIWRKGIRGLTLQPDCWISQMTFCLWKVLRSTCSPRIRMRIQFWHRGESSRI